MGLESGGNYTAKSKTSTASGKYQWIDKTWNGYGGYAHAWQAPPAVQEARAMHDITDKLARYGGNVRNAIMSWFLPSAVGNEKVANTIPKGNTITPNQYADNIMRRLGAKVAPLSATTADGASPTDEATTQMADLKDPNVQIANLLSILAAPTQKTTATF